MHRFIVDFHYQGQACHAIIYNEKIERVYCENIELNLLPEMVPDIMRIYRKRKAECFN